MRIHLPLALSVLPSLLAAAAGDGPAPAQPRSGERPNIVYVLADDLGYGEVGAYGQRKIRTPAIDQLAREGIRFTDHYSGSPLCAPSRSVLMTGLHTGHTPVRNNFGIDPQTGEEVRVGLSAGDQTVAEILQQGGYRTGLIGKWGLGEEDTEGVPLRKGFERFFGFINQKLAHNHYPDWIWDQDQRLELPGNRDGQQGAYIHDLFTDRALDFLDQARDDARPFFLYLAYTLPHSDLAVPADQERAGDDPDSIFAAMVERLDRDVGRLQARLDALGLAANTLFIFTSDNGPHSTAGKDTRFFEGAGPFRGIKRDVYEGGIRVPFIAKWPDLIKPGSVSAHVSAFWDFLPTACELAGLPVPDGIDGISYRPALLGLPNPNHPYLYWEVEIKGKGRRAVRAGDWKLVLMGGRSGPELYHLPSDPGESRNLHEAHPGIAAILRAHLEGARTPHPLFPLPTD